MRRLLLILIVILGAPLLAGVGWVFARALMAAPPSRERQTPVVTAVSSVQERRLVGAIDSAKHYVGAGGCAAAACHGDATASNNLSWKSSYSRWISQRDPHSLAYAVLKSDSSKRILWLLDGGRPDPQAAKDQPWSNAAPHRDNRCLTCHSITPDAETILPESLLADGVSCEACHGPAASWIASHTTAGWLAPGRQRYQVVELGRETSHPNTSAAKEAPRMWNTKDPVSRANLCVRCHVGGPDRDVNHDLIAAGHPRLNFEYHAFMENLPKHWDDERDREGLQDRVRVDDESRVKAKKPADYEARLWAIGQFAAAQAALMLLDERVQRSIQAQPSEQPESLSNDRHWRLGPITPAWPELSEFSCFACHHDLGARRVATAGSPGRRPLGSLPWGTWYFSEVQNKLWSLDGSGLLPLNEAVAGVRTAMEKPVALPKDVAAQLADDKARLASLSTERRGRRISISDIDRWLGAVGDLPPPESWDEATQRYLALHALTKSHQKLAGEPAKLDYVSIDRRLKEIRKKLQFDPDYQSPRHLNSDGLQQLHEKLSEVVDLFKP